MGGSAFLVYRTFYANHNTPTTLKTTAGFTTRTTTLPSSDLTGTETADTSAIGNESTMPSESVVVTETTAKATTTATTTAAIDYQDPLTYLPALNKKYTYSINYADGESGSEDVLVGHLTGKPLLSMAAVIPESEAYTDHIVQRKDGLYSISDNNPDSELKIFPATISVGDTWESSQVQFEIIDIKATCKTDYKTFKNCLVIEENFAEAGYLIRFWYAPGIGIVRSLYADSGQEYQVLTGVSSVKASEMKKLLTQYSPNIAQIK